MADVTINGSTGPDPEFGGTNCGPFWKTDQIGYRFFINSTLKVQYSKTTDGGATWSAGVTVLDTGESTDGYVRFSCWFDQETTGDSGTKIHIAGEDSHGNRVRYRSLDISSDTLGTEVTVATVATFLQGGGYPDKNWLEAGMCPIAKSRGGNLYCAFGDVTGGVRAWKLYRSTDGGATWASRNAGYGLTTNSFDNFIQLLPASDADSNDIAAITLQDNYPTATASLYLWLHDDSANSWGNQTTIDTLSSDGGDWADYVYWGDVVLRHSDGKAVCAYWSRSDYASPGSGSLKVAELVLTAAGIAATAKTSARTGVSGAQDCCLHIDQAAGTLRAVYARGTWYSSTDVYYVESSDGGSTWGTETKLNTTAHNIQHVDGGHSVKSGQSGRFAPSWADIDNLDIITNAANSVAITTSTPSAASSAPTITVSATGASLRAAAASSAPTMTVSGTGSSLAASAPSSAPAITVQPTGASNSPGAPSSAPTITVQPASASLYAGAPSSAPTISVAATSAALKAAAASSAPAITVDAGTAALYAGAPSSAPSITVDATSATGSAPSSAPSIAVAPTGAALRTADASSAPTVTAAPAGASLAAGAPSSAPTVAVDAASYTASAPSSAPAITVGVVPSALFAGAPSSAPSITVSGATAALYTGVPSSAPSITVQPASSSAVAADATSAPTITVVGLGASLAKAAPSCTPSINVAATSTAPSTEPPGGFLVL